MQSRKIALATMVMTPMARWKRDTTANVLRRLDGDVDRAVRAEPECRGVDALDRIGGSSRRARVHREAVDTVAVAEQSLQVVEMQPDAILAARDLGGIGASLHDALR